MNVIKHLIHNPRALGLFILLLLLALVPLVFGQENYIMRLATAGLCTAIAVYGLNVILGFTGLLSLAQGGFFGIGAYTVGLLTTDYGWSFWMSLLIAALLTAVLGFLCGLIALRTRDAYFAIFTMAIGFIIYLVISRWEAVTHAHTGVNGIAFPEGAGIVDFSEPVPMFYLVFIVLLLVIYGTWAISRSSVGRTLVSIRTSEDLADAIGVNVGVNKQLAFAAATTLAGIGGGFYATVVGFIGPDSATVDKTFEMLMFVLVGGVGTVAGPLVGTLLVTVLFEFFQDFQTYRFIVLGPIIIALVIFAPRGIVGYLNSFIARRKSRRGASPDAGGATPQQDPSEAKLDAAPLDGEGSQR